MDEVEQITEAIEMEPRPEKPHPVTVLLRELRAALGITQGQLAKRMGVSVATIGLYEAGGQAGKPVNPSWDFLARLVVRAGCDPRRLFPDHSDWPLEDQEGNGSE
jgi:transcriptional regulator with XRE-family HTH domain